MNICSTAGCLQTPVQLPPTAESTERKLGRVTKKQEKQSWMENAVCELLSLTLQNHSSVSQLTMNPRCQIHVDCGGVCGTDTSVSADLSGENFSLVNEKRSLSE